MSIQANASAAIQCGACGETNAAEAKFCAGCGNSLSEPCAKCSKPVLLTQKFCADCGTDLTVIIQQNQKKHEEWMVDAVSNAKQCNYDIAISLLHRVVTEADFRYGDTRKKAEAAIGKIRRLKEQNVGSAQTVQEQAENAFARADFQKTIKLLSGIPENLLTDESMQRLKSAKSQMGEHAALHGELQNALKAKNWQLVGSFTQQLLNLQPNSSSYQNLAKQVSEKLMSSAKKLLSNHQYEDASEKLQSVPECGRDENYCSLIESIENIQALSVQFDGEPFATPTLGRLAVRFAKETPDNPASKALVSELAKAVKQTPAKRNTFPFWREQRTSPIGGPVGILGQPSKIDLAKFKEHRQHPGQFNVAIGLALQGLGLTRVTENFMAAKKGLLSSLSRKKVTTAWGIDIGSTMVRAIRLEIVDGETVVADLQVAEFDTPTCRKDAVKIEDAVPAILKPLIEKNEQSFRENPVWVNLPTTDVVHRFACLPPVKDKQAQSLLEAEVSQKIPLAAEEIQVVKWMSGLSEKNPAAGRPVMIAATRKTRAQRRLKMFADAGLNVDGMQCDTVALANFACFEFDEELADESDSGQNSPGIMLVDCGATATNVVIVSHSAVFLSCNENGGEDLTTVIARHAKLTNSDADKLKRDPAKIANPSVALELMDQKMAESRQRLEKIIKFAKDQNLKSDIVQTWCVGGGALCHGWVRNVLLKEN